MTVSVEILTRSNTIVCGDHRLSTRSKGVIALVCLLLWKKRTQPESAWVGIYELRHILPTTYGRQMLRYIDTLADIGFPMEYESKTRGRYRLALPPERVKVDVDEGMLERIIGIVPSAPAAAPFALVGGRDNLPGSLRILESFSRLNLAQSQFYDGNLGGEANHAYHLFLCESETAPPEWRGIALLQLAKTSRRLNRYDEALAALRRLFKLLRSGGAPGLAIKAALCKAMVHFDQGHIAQMTNLIKKLDMSGCSDSSTLGEYYNLKGLLAYYDIQQCREVAAKVAAPSAQDIYAVPLKIIPPADPDAYRVLLEITAHYYHEALVLHAGTGDYNAMQHACFNLGDLFLYALINGILPQEDALELGMKWMAQCEFISHKFGVGMDSVQSRIVLIKTAMQCGFGMAELNAFTNGMFRNHASLEELARATLATSQAIGDRLEQAQVFEILMRLALQRGDRPYAETCRSNMLKIYRDLKRADLARPFKAPLPEAADPA